VTTFLGALVGSCLDSLSTDLRHGSSALPSSESHLWSACLKWPIGRVGLRKTLVPLAPRSSSARTTKVRYGRMRTASASRRGAVARQVGHPNAETDVAAAAPSLAWGNFVRRQLDQARRGSEVGLDPGETKGASTELATVQDLSRDVDFRQSEFASALHRTMRAMVPHQGMAQGRGATSSPGNPTVAAIAGR
jgi:hypothetical protein